MIIHIRQSEIYSRTLHSRLHTAPDRSGAWLDQNLGGRTGKILRPSSVALKRKNQEINRLQLAVKLPWAIFFESADILS
ncbi:hypothetical protein TNCV_2133411 [Trichonephila clavipes]|nr:hypothetical protein TNCV_2133411 [Trichonephila clavipes]